MLTMSGSPGGLGWQVLLAGGVLYRALSGGAGRGWIAAHTQLVGVSAQASRCTPLKELHSFLICRKVPYGPVAALLSAVSLELGTVPTYAQ